MQVVCKNKEACNSMNYRLLSFLMAVRTEPQHNDFASNYTLRMEYGNTGEIQNKVQEHYKNNILFIPNTYENSYKYAEGSHKVNDIRNRQTNQTETFRYDLNGNIITRNFGNKSTKLYWDEANRMRVAVMGSNIGQAPNMQHYIYDASGERILKASSRLTEVFVNGTLQSNEVTMDNYTTYPSGFLVVDPEGIYSKHYYMGAQRIASRIGDGSMAMFEGKAAEMPELKALQQKDLQYYAQQAGINNVSYAAYKPSTLKDIADEDDNRAPEQAIYFYHSDHLGTNTFLTDPKGLPYQFFLNLPFGETMAEQHSEGYFQSPYKFNGKELDKETGLYYYGARYYDPRISLWLSVDPLVSKNKGVSPFAYCLNNPIVNIDPNGKDVYLVVWTTANGKPGHSGIAVSNYRAVASQVKENGRVVSKTSYVPDGSFTYYDLWPGGAGAGKDNYDKDLPAIYQKFDELSWNDIVNKDPSKGEKRNPEGIIKLTTNYEQDQNVVKVLDARKDQNVPYNGKTNNCSDNAECGVEATGVNINADEIIKTGTTATIPNSLYKSAKKLPNASVLRNPGSAVNNGFIEGAAIVLGRAKQEIMGGVASPDCE
jgi:RHS repeat-associated protein